MRCTQVAVQPQLPGLVVEALPESLLERTVLSKVLPRDAWDTLRRAAYKRSGMKCAPHSQQTLAPLQAVVCAS